MISKSKPYNKKTKKNNMPTLNWIGKDKVVSHHQDVPYRVLEHKYGFTADNGEQNVPTSGNKIIHGDNLEALKSLLPEYEGKIKCIYIDHRTIQEMKNGYITTMLTTLK